MGFKVFLYLIRCMCDHPDSLSNQSPGFRDISEYECGMCGLSDSFPHFLQL